MSGVMVSGECKIVQASTESQHHKSNRLCNL